MMVFYGEGTTLWYAIQDDLVSQLLGALGGRVLPTQHHDFNSPYFQWKLLFGARG